MDAALAANNYDYDYDYLLSTDNIHADITQGTGLTNKCSIIILVQ